MKTKFKRVLSIFLILCLTLTMMPGLALVSFAQVDTWGDYTLYVNYPGHCSDLLPDGSSFTATTGVAVTRYDENGNVYGKEYIDDYSVDVELTLLDEAEAGLVTYEVDNDNMDITFTANDQGKTGSAEAVIKFYVDGGLVGSITSHINVMNTIWHWPDTLPGEHEDFYTNPEIGNVLDFSNLKVVEYNYVPATEGYTSYTETNVIDANTEGFTFSMSYDEECWEPVGDTTGLHAIKRMGTWANGIEVGFTKVFENGESNVSIIYDVDSLNYEVSFVTDIFYAYEDETSKNVEINIGNLFDKKNPEYKVELGYIDEQAEEFVAFENQSDLFTMTTPDTFISIKVNPSQLAALDTNGNQIIARVMITSNGYEVYTTEAAIEIKENVETFNIDSPENMVVGSNYESPLWLYSYVENSEFPDGHQFNFDITGIEVISGAGDVLTVDYSVEDNWMEFVTTGTGEAEVKFTYEKLDGSEGEVVMTFTVHEEIYHVQLMSDGYTNAIIPGGLTQTIGVEVNKEMADFEYEWDIEADLEWEVASSEYESYITFTEGPDNTVTIGAKAGTPVDGEEWIVVLCNAYKVDEEGNRIKDENGEDILLGTGEYEFIMTSEELYVELEGFDDYAEVGESRVVIPNLKHMYLDEDGKYVEEYIKMDSWEFEYNPEHVSITDNHDGSYTIKRLSNFDIEICVRGIEGEASHASCFYLSYLEYWATIFAEPNYVMEGKETVLSINEEFTADLRYVTYDWIVEYYDGMEYRPLDEADGYYTVADDGKSITLDGTKIYALNTDELEITLDIYSEVGDEKYEMNCEMSYLNVYGANDDLPPGEPEELTGSEFLALADENGNIKLENNVILKEPIVIADGKTYSVDLYGCEIYAPEHLDDGVIVTNGTIKFTSSKTYKPEEDSDEEYTANGTVCADATNTIVVDGPIGQANVILDKTVVVAGFNPIVVKSGTLKSAAIINVWENPDTGEFNDFLTIVDKDKVDITLTGGNYNNDVSEYVPDTHTFIIEAFKDVETETVHVYYNVVEKVDDLLELMDEYFIFFVGEDGNYYYDEEAAQLIGVEAERIGYWVEFYLTDQDGEFDEMTGYVSIVGKVGMSVKEAYKWYAGQNLEEGTGDGVHFAGWYEAESIEWGETCKITEYGTEKIDLDKPMTKDLTLATKWCSAVATEVVGKVEPTYLVNGYTGDTVCTECGTVIEKGEVIDKLVPIEEGKVDVTEEALDEAIQKSVAQDSTEVVIPLGDVNKEVKEVELPVASVETIIESGKDLTVETPEATVTLDTKALEAVTSEAEGQTVVLQVEAIEENDLNSEQKKAVQKFDVAKVISAEIICAKTNKIVSEDFGGGKATVKLPFEPAEGENVADYKVAYIADDGTVTIIPTTYVGGKLVFEIEHFSEYAIVKEKPVINNPFTDLIESEYYYDAVLWAVDQGITTGATATTFEPEEDCTRAQVVTFLWRAAGKPTANVTNPFTDLDTNEYYYEAVLWAVEQGITTGTSATTFEPDETVTRDQFVTFLWRMLGKPAANCNNPFIDLDTNEYYYEAVLWAYENGVTTGATATTFEPTANCLRSQVVTFIYRALV